jgi:hypothetical protein
MIFCLGVTVTLQPVAVGSSENVSFLQYMNSSHEQRLEFIIKEKWSYCKLNNV